MAIEEIAGAVKKKISEKTYYYATISSDRIKSVTYVPVLEKSINSYVIENVGGYQRPGSRSRMRQFMRYLRDNSDTIVPPIMLSGQNRWRFEEYDNLGYGKLVIEGPAAIIDGQHRVGGYIALFEELGEIRPIDFIFLESLSYDDEVKAFMTVNNTQKGVPKPLTAYLENTEGARIAWALNVEDDSPFKNRITRTTRGRQHLFALHSFAKQVVNTFKHGKLVDLDEEQKIEIMKQYWNIISDVFWEQWADIDKLDDPATRGRNDFGFKLLDLVGLVAWSIMGGRHILSRCYLDGAGINWDNVKKIVESCGKLDWRKKGQYQAYTGESGGNHIVQDMERLLPLNIHENAEEE